jgi:predicted extracellular nuclease
MRWNTTRYNKKIASLYKTITSAGEWEAPAIVALCEVENRKILEDLIFGSYLSKYNYGIIHKDSPDPRGIDVCLIYRKDVLKVIQNEFWIPTQKAKGDFKSRSILYAKVAIGNDTLHLIVNHWPSRRGGVLAREDARLEIADMVRYKADSILKVSSLNARIIIIGDFNSTPDDTEIKRLVENMEGSPVLVNLSEGLSFRGGGTYRYQGTWEMIDQVIVSESLLNCKNGLYTGEQMVKVFKPDFLLMKDPKYPGMVPFSTYRGYRYQGGFSDHLPVLVDLGVR